MFREGRRDRVDLRRAPRSRGSSPTRRSQLLKTFADQAVIAIENVRLFTELDARNRDLTEALEQQTATSEILRVIASSPTDVQPVFDTIAAARGATVRRRRRAWSRGSMATLHRAGRDHGHRARAVKIVRTLFPMPLDAQAVTGARHPGRATSSTSRTFSLNRTTSSRTSRAAARIPQRSSAYPLLRDGRSIGAIFVGRREAGPFTDKQIELLKTFADQAVIAIENVRLFTELEARNRDLTEALEQQTATSEILRVISQLADRRAAGVRHHRASSAARLCGAEIGSRLRVRRRAASSWRHSRTSSPKACRCVAAPLPDADRVASTVTARAILDAQRRRTFPTCSTDPDYAIQATRTAARLPQRAGRAAAARGQRRSAPSPSAAPKPGPFTDKQIELLKTFADQAVIAIENVRLFKELEARTTRADALGGRAEGAGRGRPGGQLDAGSRNRADDASSPARRSSPARTAARSTNTTRRARSSTCARPISMPDELIDGAARYADPQGRGRGRAAGGDRRAGRRSATSWTSAPTRAAMREILVRAGLSARCWRCRCCARTTCSAAWSSTGRAAGEFAPEVIELLKTFATQSALAIQNARLFREIEDKSRQLETASRHK